MAAEPVVHVIDDDETARESLEFLLDCAGLRVQAYESAVSFLKAVPAMEHGCIVTDVRMPEMGGVELIGRLKALGVPDPVIVITGHADVPLANQAQAERDRILAKLETLSQREREVLDGLVEGHANKVIAFDLDISARTVEVYRANVMTKMQAGSLSELVRMVTIARLF